MRHKSWIDYRLPDEGTPRERAEKLASRRFIVRSTLNEDDVKVVSPLTGEPISVDPTIEQGSLEWVDAIAQMAVDNGPDGVAISFVEDLAMTAPDGETMTVDLVPTDGAVTFFSRGI